MVSHFLADCVRLPRHRYRQQIMRHSITYQHFDEVSALPTSIPFLAASWLSHVVTDFSLVFFGQSLTFEKNSSKEPALAFYLHKQPGIPTLMKKLYKLVTLLHLILLLQRCLEIYTTEILCLKSCPPVTHSKYTIELSKQHTKHCDGRNSHPLLWRIPVQGVTNRPCEASSDPCCLNFCSKRLYRDRSPTMQRE